VDARVGEVAAAPDVDAVADPLRAEGAPAAGGDAVDALPAGGVAGALVPAPEVVAAEGEAPPAAKEEAEKAAPSAEEEEAAAAVALVKERDAVAAGEEGVGGMAEEEVEAVEGIAPPAPPTADPHAQASAVDAALPAGTTPPSAAEGGVAAAKEVVVSEGAGSGSPAAGLSYEEAVQEREKVRAERDDGGKVGVSAPRDDAAAMEAEMLAAELVQQEKQQEQEQGRHAELEAATASNTLLAARGAADDSVEGAAAADNSVEGRAAAEGAGDLSAVDQSQISAVEVSQMAQTLGADFLGSTLLEADKAGGAEGAEKRAGASFDAAASERSGEPADVKGLSATGASLGATSATALSMADTKAQTRASGLAADAGDTRVSFAGTLSDGDSTAAALQRTVLDGTLEARDETHEGEEGEEGEAEGGAAHAGGMSEPASPTTRPGTQQTRPATSKTDDTGYTEQSANLTGAAAEVVVRSVLHPQGGKGRQKYLGHLIPLGQIDDVTLFEMARLMNLPDLPPPPAAAAEGDAPGALDPEDREELVEAIAEDERGRHALCIQLQAMARGVSTRTWFADKVAVMRQQKEMEKMEAAIEAARTNGAAETLQRVARGHAGRLATRDRRKEIEDEKRAAMFARWAYMEKNLGREASLITRVAKGHVARNIARSVAADLEKERQLAFLDLQAQQDVAGAYEFDPDEDDMDDELEEQDEKGGDTLEEDAELDFGDDATPRAVTKWYEKVIYPERHFPYTYESLGTDVNAAAARRIQTVYRARLARQALEFRQRHRRRALQAGRQNAARNIQMAFRQHLVLKGEEVRRVNATLGEVRQRSATRIQAMLRGSILRIHVARRRAMEEALQRQRVHVASVTMQSLARGFLERCRAVERRREQAALALVFKAAQKIQVCRRAAKECDAGKELSNTSMRDPGEPTRDARACAAGALAQFRFEG
jgi:hypothetical protein